MDFMKVFDKVPHERLLKKVEAYGIGGTVNRHCSMWSRPFILPILLPIYRAELPNSKRIVLVPKCYV